MGLARASSRRRAVQTPAQNAASSSKGSRGKTIFRAYRVRLAPTIEQRKYLARCVGVARVAYNWALEAWQREYRAYRLAVRAPGRTQRLLSHWSSPLASDPRWTVPPGPKPTAYSIQKRLTAVKREKFPWMTEVSAFVIREAVKDVG